MGSANKLPKHIQSATVERIVRAYRGLADERQDIDKREKEATSRRYRAERDMTDMLRSLKYAEGDSAIVHHDGVVTQVTLEKPSTGYSYRSDPEAIFRSVKNQAQSDDKDAQTGIGMVASRWHVAKLDEARIKEEGSAIYARYQTLEKEMLGHITDKLPNDWTDRIAITFLTPEGWACWIVAFRESAGLGKWVISMAMSSVMLGSAVASK